jgi:hypothetical protein
VYLYEIIFSAIIYQKKVLDMSNFYKSTDYTKDGTTPSTGHLREEYQNIHQQQQDNYPSGTTSTLPQHLLHRSRQHPPVQQYSNTNVSTTTTTNSDQEGYHNSNVIPSSSTYGGYYGTSSTTTIPDTAASASINSNNNNVYYIDTQPANTSNDTWQSSSPTQRRKTYNLQQQYQPQQPLISNITVNSSTDNISSSSYNPQQQQPPHARNDNFNYNSTKQQQLPISCAHNTMIALLWVPCWCCIYLKFHKSNTIFPTILFIISWLIVYGIDLANLRRTYTLYVVWITTVIQMIFNVWYQLLQIEDGTDDGILMILFSSGVHAMFFICTASWFTLQNQWLIPKMNIHSRNNSIDDDTHDDFTNSTFRQCESVVHGILPPIFAALVTCSISNWFNEEQNITTMYNNTIDFESIVTVTPYLFMILLVFAMLSVGALPSTLFISKMLITTSAVTTIDNNDKSHSGQLDGSYYCIPQSIALGHVRLLIYVPGIIHFFTCWNRLLFNQYINHYDIYDFLLTVTIPYLVLITIVQFLHTTNRIRSPYGILLSNEHKQLQQQRRDQICIILSAIIASWSFQQRYLISLCHTFSYHYFGTQIPTWQCTIYWTCTFTLFYVAIYIWGKINPITNQLVFGEYHDDIVQMVLATFGLCLGKAFGLPWSMTPLPILGILGLTFWINTRMLRYMFIILFVVHSIGVIAFTYRFVGIDQTLSLAFPRIELSLVRFGMLLTMSSVTIGLITGLAVRSSGGYMAPWIKKLDVVGILIIVYSLLLMILEITLLKRQAPIKELTGSTEIEDYDIDESLYDVPRVLFTSFIMIAIGQFMKRVRILHAWSASVVISLSIGKAIAIYTYAAQAATHIGSYNHHDARGTTIIYRSLIASILCATMFVPRVFLEPIRLKNAIRNRRTSNGVGRAASPAIPPHAVSMISLYAFGFVPFSLLATLPYVVFPLINALRAQFTQMSYYSTSPPISELIGSAIALWGLALISMLNHYLPDGGGEIWKKTAAIAFLMGMGIYFLAPTIGIGIGSAMYNPYASMSSVGEQIILRSKSRTSGWGIVSSAMATFLAASGPLELKERVYSSGRKDKYLLLRTIVFGFLFGGGLSWFIVLQCMSESGWLLVILTVLATMVLSFLGTIATVLGYFLEADNFDEIEQIATTWICGLVTFLPITGIPFFLLSSESQWSGPSGWLSPYLGIGSLTSFAFALSLSCRQNKDSRTRGLGNTACIISWLLSNIVLYGRYGVAGLDANYDLSAFAGVPISVLGTIALSTILLVLDGETSSPRRERGGGRATVTTSHRHMKTFWRLNLPQLVQKNRWYPLYAGIVTIFMVATLYAILCRGSDLLSFVGPSLVEKGGNVIQGETEGTGEGDEFLTALVRATMAQSTVVSSKLANTSVWTSNNIVRPLLYLLGTVAIVPSFVLLIQQYWWNKTIRSSYITTTLPLNAIPILFCHGLPTLTAAAFLTLLCATMQLIVRQQSEHASRMRI